MKKFIIIAIIIAVVVGSGVGVIAYASDGFDLPVSEWGNRLGIKDEERPNEEDKKDPPGVIGGVVDGNGNSMSVTGVNVMPAAMFFSTDKLEDSENSSVTITANIIPNNATNKDVSWSIQWNNPESEWATGKAVTDYISVTQDPNNGVQAKVTCLQPFAEQALIVCTSRANVTISKSCKVDYNKRLIGKADISYSGEGVEYTLKSGQKNVIKPTDYNSVGWGSGSVTGNLNDLTYSVGTLMNNVYSVESVTLDISEHFRQFLSGLEVLNSEFADGAKEVTEETFTQTGYTALSLNSLLAVCTSAESISTKMPYILAYATDGNADITLTFNISDEISYEVEIVLDFTEAYVKVTGIGLDQGQIVF